MQTTTIDIFWSFVIVLMKSQAVNVFGGIKRLKAEIFAIVREAT